jgi:hypothetical protein
MSSALHRDNKPNENDGRPRPARWENMGKGGKRWEKVGISGTENDFLSDGLPYPRGVWD